jgi:hypothetical protein
MTVRDNVSSRNDSIKYLGLKSQQYTLPCKQQAVYHHCCPTQQWSHITMETSGQRHITILKLTVRESVVGSSSLSQRTFHFCGRCPNSVSNLRISSNRCENASGTIRSTSSYLQIDDTKTYYSVHRGAWNSDKYIWPAFPSLGPYDWGSVCPYNSDVLWQCIILVYIWSVTGNLTIAVTETHCLKIT